MPSLQSNQRLRLKAKLTVSSSSSDSPSSYESYFANAPDLVAGGTAVSYSAVGTTSLGLLYSLTLPGIIWCRRYPHRVKLMLRLALVVNVLSMIISSFANNVAVLILFQGVVGGISAGLMWSPVYVYASSLFISFLTSHLLTDPCFPFSCSLYSSPNGSFYDEQQQEPSSLPDRA